MAKSYFTYDVTHKKTENLNQKLFFSLETRRFA